MSKSSITYSSVSSTTYPFEWINQEQEYFVSSKKCVSASLGAGDISTTSWTYTCPYCDFISVERMLVLYHQLIRHQGLPRGVCVTLE